MPKKILVGILDWGLGHATRSIPLIGYLRQFQCQIFIAATGSQKKILLEAFPEAEFLDPPAYAIRYPTNGRNMFWAILLQLPRLYRTVQQERAWVEANIQKHQFDLVISDNRYGFHSRGAHSVFITHQLAPDSGLGPVLNNWLRRWHYRFIRVFDECWVPDLEAAGGLAGALSHPSNLPLHTSYIGPLSRLEPVKENQLDQLLVLISGPEPARSQFEILVSGMLRDYQGRFVLVRGLPGEQGPTEPGVYHHANASTLEKLVAQSSLVICRSGYTSVMDLVKMGKKAVLVPTPGQPEQEYLAAYLEQKGIFPFVSQSAFVLSEAIQKAEKFHYQFPDIDFQYYKKALDKLIKN